jgi:phosphatidate cytidylyltransferase
VGTRGLTALVLGAAVVSAIAAGPLWLLALLLAAATILGLREIAALAAHAGISFGLSRTAAGSLLILGGALGGGAPGMNLGFALAVLVVIIASLRGSVKGAMAALGVDLFALLIPAWSLAHALLVADRPQGRVELLFLLFVIWACDSAAYFIGVRYGRHRLAPEISPAKSVEGLAAGILSAPMVAWLFWRFAPGFPFPLAGAALVGMGMALLGQLGDLTESLLKRDAGVKDSGGLIPGHGGVLDRVDALLLALPAYYYLIVLRDAAR